jgi:hypothetical protein
MNQYLRRLTEQQDQYGDDQSSAASAGLGIILGVGALFMLPFMFSDAPQYQQPLTEGSKASILPTDPNRDEAIMALWDYAFYNGYSLGSWGPMTGTRWFPVTLKGSPAGDHSNGYALGAADNIRRLLSHEPEGLGLRGSPLDFTKSVIWKLGPPITKDEQNYILKFLKNHTTFNIPQV